MHKYNIGDKVFFLQNNRIQKVTISSITILITKVNTNITYSMEEKTACTYGIELPIQASETECFSTKQELIDSL